MILTCLYLTGCGREEVPYLDTTQTQEQTVETEQKETLKSDQTVQVYVCGEVAAPGVYQLKDGMRICDAVEAAGGLPNRPAHEFGAKRLVARGRLCRPRALKSRRVERLKGAKLKRKCDLSKQAAFSFAKSG